MQNTHEKRYRDEKSAKKSFFKYIGERLRDRDEFEVRARLRKFVDFALNIAIGYMLGGAELLFSTYPICIALLCSSQKKLLPISIGLLISALSGGFPEIYIFTCIATPLIRVLMAYMPIIFAEMKDARAEKGRSLIKFNPHLPEKRHAGNRENRDEKLRSGSALLFREKLSVRASAAALGGLLTGIFLLIQQNFSFYALWSTLFLVAACPVAVLLLSGELGDVKAGRVFSLVSLCTLGALAVWSARSMTVIGMPMAPFLALLLTLCLTAELGVVSGGVGAIVFGVVYEPIYMPLLFICSLLFFLVSTVKRGAGLAVVCAAVVIWCYYLGGTHGLVYVLPPMLLAIPVFMIVDKYREMIYAPYNREAAMAGGLYFAEAVTEKSKNDAVRERLGALSEVFAALSETFYKLSDKRRRPDTLGLKKICEDAFDSSCRNCPEREVCYGARYNIILDAIGRMAVTLRASGKVSRDDVGDEFPSLCPHTERICSEVNRALDDATESLIKDERLGFFASSYEDINEILRDALENDGEDYNTDTEAAERLFDLLCEKGFRVGGIVVWGKRCRNIVIKGIPSVDKLSAKGADELRRLAGEAVGVELCEPMFEVGRDGSVMRLSSKPLFRAKCAHGHIAADGGEPLLDTSAVYVDPFKSPPSQNEICGDTDNCFITNRSYFYSLISDGMGSGEEAAFVSGVCSMFIEKMLSAGNRADITIRMLNNVLRNENMGRGGECSATVDLCELDLISGTASFIKSGAAPTYIARGGTVFKVYSHSMPIGILKDADAKINKFDTKKGDIIIMMSDGCCPDSEDCPWLVEFLCEYMSKKDKNALGNESECENLKDKLLSLAVKNFPDGKARDDISVSVIIIE